MLRYLRRARVEFDKEYTVDIAMDGSNIGRIPLEMYYAFFPFLNMGFTPPYQVTLRNPLDPPLRRVAQCLAHL
jgi:hypothetical protein